MDSMLIQLDTSESSRPWRCVMKDDGVGTGIMSATTARLSQTFLEQGVGGKDHQKGSTFTLKPTSSGDSTTSTRSGADRGDTSEADDCSPPRSPMLPALSPSGSSSEDSTAPSATDTSPESDGGQPFTNSSTFHATSSPAVATGFLRARAKPEQRILAPPPGDPHYPPATMPTKSSPASFASPYRASLKRARPPSDVDGPYTSTLGCKKRRLLRHLVTSRLSRLFSIPATHVPNLEITIGLTGGGGMEKRFLRLAATAAARRAAQSSAPSAAAQLQLRQQPHSTPPSEVLRRAAIINRFRRRVFLDAAERGDAAVAEMAASAALLRFSPGVNAAVGSSGLARFPGSSASGPRPAEVLMPPPPRPTPPFSASLPSTMRMAMLVNGANGPSQLTKATPAATAFQDSSPGPARQTLTPPTPFALPTSIVAGGSLSRVAAIARRQSISPGMTPPGSPSKGMRPVDSAAALSPRMKATVAGRLPSISPRLQPLCSSDDDEGVAFPTSEHESRYDESGEDSDDVYTDFSVMFGGGGGGSGDGGEDDDGTSGSEIDGYDEFMDELDGIPWSAR